jgi:CHAD domain-containing protein
MNKKKLNDINKKLNNKLKKQTKAILPHFDEKAIHNIRVCYKKLRAFLRMLSQQKGSTDSIKISNKLKACFKMTGSIRDIQLQQQLILKAVKNKEIKKPTMYLSLLQNESDQLKEELLKIAATKTVIENSRKIAVLLPNKFSIKKFRSFLNKQWDIIDTILLSGNLSDDNIHTIRKSIKDIFFNLKIYEKTKHGMLTVGIWKGKDEAYFSALLSELGNFQDRCTGIGFLRANRIGSLNKQNKETLNEIKKEWLKEKTAIKKMLVKRLKNELLLH